MELREVWAKAQEKGLPATRKKSEDLIKKGANPKARDDKEGWSAIFFACCYGEGQDIEALLAAGSSMSEVNKLGEDPMTAAISRGWGAKPGAIEAMIKGGGDIEGRDAKEGKGLARWSMDRGQGAMVEKLVRAGADLFKKNKDGKTLWDRLWQEGGNQISWGALAIEALGEKEGVKHAAAVEAQLRKAFAWGKEIDSKEAKTVLDWIERTGRWRGVPHESEGSRLDLALWRAMVAEEDEEVGRLIIKKGPPLSFESDGEACGTLIYEFAQSERGWSSRLLAEWVERCMEPVETAAVLWMAVGAMEAEGKDGDDGGALLKELKGKAKASMEAVSLELMSRRGAKEKGELSMEKERPRPGRVRM